MNLNLTAKMAKLVLAFLALVALQGCYGAFVQSPRLTEKDKVILELITAKSDIDEIISYIVGHLIAIARDYEYKINEIVEKKPIYPILDNLKQSIKDLESKSPTDSKQCFDSARETSSEVKEFMSNGLDGCLSEAHKAAAHITSLVQIIEARAINIQTQITTGIHKCMFEDEGNVKCLKEVLESVKSRIADIKKELEAVHEHVHEDVVNAIRNLNICLQELKIKVSIQSDDILSKLRQCAKKYSEFSKLLQKKLNIHQLYKDLKEKIEYIVQIMSHLPESIQEIPDRINVIVYENQAEIVYFQIKTEIFNILEAHGFNSEKCQKEAEASLAIFSQYAQQISNNCTNAVQSIIDTFEGQINDLIEKGKQLKVDVLKQILECGINEKCLVQHADEFVKKLTILQKDLDNSFSEASKKIDISLESLTSCLNSVKLEFINEGQYILSDLKICVENVKF